MKVFKQNAAPFKYTEVKDSVRFTILQDDSRFYVREKYM